MVAAAETARAAGSGRCAGSTTGGCRRWRYLRQLVAAGRLGTIRHVRAVYLQDWIVDPQFPLVWRLQREKAGSGALGDIGAHIVDLTQYVTGQSITGVSALTETFVKERPLPSRGERAAAAGVGDARPGQVTVDDAALFLARLSGGAIATYEATRFATGRKNGLRVEVNGSLGSAVFDLERLNELEFYDATRARRRTGLHPHPRHRGRPPLHVRVVAAGHIIGYEHSFTHQMRDFIEAVAVGKDPEPSFADALQVQQVLDAVERSAAAGSGWTDGCGGVVTEGFPAALRGRGGCAPRVGARPGRNTTATNRHCSARSARALLATTPRSGKGIYGNAPQRCRRRSSSRAALTRCGVPPSP